MKTLAALPRSPKPSEGPGGRSGCCGGFLPGITLGEEFQLPRQALPENFSLNVEKTDDGPANIKVKRGNEEWTVTEDTLDELPDDLRPLVENMLSGSRTQLFGLIAPNADPTPRRDSRRPRGDTQPQLQKRFDGLELQLKELQDAIRAMQKDRE